MQKLKNKVLKTWSNVPQKKSLILLALALVLFITPTTKIPVLDDQCDAYFNRAITQATASYATVRVINAGVSVIKESHIEINPAGVGISLAVGQVLDPIDDMSERLSNIFVTAITSLGMQKLFYEISIELAPKTVAILLFIAFLLTWSSNRTIISFQNLLFRVAVIVLLLRLALPISSLINSYVQEEFFMNKIEVANKNLSFLDTSVKKLTNFKLPEINGFTGTISNSVDVVKKESRELTQVFRSLYRKKSMIIENLLDLAILYLFLFVFQVVVLPILMFWIIIKVINSLLDKKYPTILNLHHSYRDARIEELGETLQ